MIINLLQILNKSSSAYACSVCFAGSLDDPMNEGLRMAIIALIAIVAVLMVFFICFFINFSKHHKKI